MAEFVKVAKRNEIAPGQGREVQLMGKPIALFNVGGQFCAIDGSCSHRGGPLADGELTGYEVMCPIHGARFDVRTGEVLGPPAEGPVACYNVRVSGDDVEVEV